jgi:hypothetical protein
LLLLTVLCGCGLGQDPIEALCQSLASGSRSLTLTAKLKPGQSAACPGLETLQIQANRDQDCGAGCHCALDDFQTHTEVDTGAVFGTKTTYLYLQRKADQNLLRPGNAFLRSGLH